MSEKAILIGLITPKLSQDQVNEYLEELSFLAQTAGVKPVKRFTQKLPNPEDFEVWEPEPQVVVTGSINTPPSDAIIIFDGTNFDYWQHSVTKDPVKWILNKDKSMTVKLGTGSIETKFEHGSIQLHIEWKTPEVVKGSGQSRGCLLYTSPSPRDGLLSRMPSSA